MSITYAFTLATALALTTATAATQQTCASRSEDGNSRSSTYVIGGKKDAARREVILQCTEKDDVVKVALRDMTTRRVLQTFHVRQMQTYLEASTPDMDGDGYADLVLVSAWGNPNAIFQAWRYDPIQDRLSTVIQSSGIEFVRTRSGDIVVYAKGGADAWSYTIFKWRQNRLDPAYTIEEQVGSETECTYYDIRVPSRARPIQERHLLKQLQYYCGIGGSGLIETANNLLKQ